MGGTVACMNKLGMHKRTKCWSENVKERGHFWDLRVDRRGLEWIQLANKNVELRLS